MGVTGVWTPVDFQKRVTDTRPDMAQSQQIYEFKPNMLSNASNIAIERGFVLDDGFFCSHVTYNLQLDTRPEKSLYTPLYVIKFKH